MKVKKTSAYTRLFVFLSVLLVLKAYASSDFEIYTVGIPKSLANKIRTCCKAPRTAVLSPLNQLNCRQNVSCFKTEMDKIRAQASNTFNRKFLREIPPVVIENLKSQCLSNRSLKTEEDQMNCWLKTINDTDPNSSKPPMNKKVAVVLLKRFMNQFHALTTMSVYCHLSGQNMNLKPDGTFASLKDTTHTCGKADLNLMRFGSVPFKPYPYDKLPHNNKSQAAKEAADDSEGDGDSETESAAGNSNMIHALFNVSDASGLGAGIECPHFIPRAFCADHTKFNPLHYEFSDDIWPPRYNPTVNMDLGDKNLGKALDEIYEILEGDFQKKLLDFLIQIHMEKYLEASLISMGSQKGLESFEELKSIGCNNESINQVQYNQIHENVKKAIPGVPQMVDSEIQNREKETILAAHCMEAIEERLSKLKSLFGMDINPAKKILDPNNSDSTIGKIAISTAQKIPIIGSLLSNAQTLNLSEDQKRLCGRTAMIAQAGNMKMDYVDPLHPENGALAFRPKDGWNRYNYCLTAFKEYEDLAVEVGRIYSKYPILGENARGNIPLYKELNRSAGPNDPARNLTRNYSRDYHFVGNANKPPCLSNYVDSAGKIAIEPASGPRFLMSAGSSLYISPLLSGIKSQIKQICEDSKKYVDTAVKNPLFMRKFFTCGRVPLLEFASVAKVPPQVASKHTLDTQTCNERYSMTWLACRKYKDVKEDEGIASALSGSLMALGELAQLMPFGTATKAGASIVLKDALTSGAFSGLLTLVTAKSRDDLIQEQRERQGWVRAGLGSYDDYKKATEAIIQLESNPDPKIIEIISSVLGSAGTSMSGRDIYNSPLFKDSLSKAGPGIMKMSAGEIREAIKERMQKIKEAYAKMKDAGKRGMFGDDYGKTAEASLSNFLDQQKKMLKHLMLQLKVKTGLISDDLIEELMDRKRAIAVVPNKRGGQSYTFKAKDGREVVRHYDKSDGLVYQTITETGPDLSDFGRGTIHQTTLLGPDNKPAGFFQYDCFPPGCSKVANIDVKVEEHMWNKGIYSEQLDLMLKKHPEINVIETELMYSNARAYRDLFWGTGNKARAKYLAGAPGTRTKRVQEGFYNAPEHANKPVAASIEAFDSTPAGKWRKRNGFCTHLEMPNKPTPIKEPPPELPIEVMRAIWEGNVRFISTRCN